MKKYPTSPPSLGGPDEQARTLLESGGLNYRQLRGFSLPSPIKPDKDLSDWDLDYAALMRTVWGASDEEFTNAIEYESYRHPERPHIFEAKARYRHMRSPWPDSSTRLIGEDEFSELYAAAEFAAEFHLWFDTTVTLNWGTMGFESTAEKQFLAFTKCVRSWWPPHVPYVAIYAHEHSAEFGLHTHMALYVPFYLRRQFRDWAMSWPKRQLGKKAPGSVRVRIHKDEQPWLHWVTTSYLMKGYDPNVIVKSARNTADSKPIYLGDLIAAPWRNPGPVRLRHRVGSSRSLKPAARANGVPAGMEYLKKKQTRIVTLFPQAKIEIVPAEDSRYRPFRSKYEDGARDVRILYPPEFLTWLNKGRVEAPGRQHEEKIFGEDPASFLPEFI